MNVPPLINTIPVAEVSPLNFNRESEDKCANLAATIIQVVESSFNVALLFGMLLHEKKVNATISIEILLRNFI